VPQGLPKSHRRLARRQQRVNGDDKEEGNGSLRSAHLAGVGSGTHTEVSSPVGSLTMLFPWKDREQGEAGSFALESPARGCGWDY